MSDKRNHGKKPAPPFFNYQPMKQKNALSPKVSNHNVDPDVITGKATVKVPVVLAETVVQLELNPKIEFPEPVLEIKNIKKNLKITQCRLLLPTNKLFLAGFVRKNIQYATPKYGTKDAVISSIRSLTIDVPFNAVTEIDYIRKPQFSFGPQDQTFTFFTKSELPAGFSSKEHLLSGDLSQFDQFSGEEFNELPYCELLSSRFIQYDESLDRKMGQVYNQRGECIKAPFEEGTFTKIEEKMVVEIKLKVLQKQQMNVDSKK
ncbi:hypothetical protein BKP45_01445 [Anaerobacillus alkalidiazotrophicus]|uniref:DUF7852 domain-containing protein n=1 Tax=Anaerobacillus alkalidiazotrophicus TaxID=472963 RepID=A0A1S2M9P3_9BACI|nr:hypothetical protein [Anaerobacillus alkalidiazotrophicus]OIJ21462.1 hypothetical protein BKP45_01445 [Anaerobacillus alkalidiazotrophicus]